MSLTIPTEGFITGERARFGPTVVLGIAHDYKNFSQWLDQNLIPEKASIYRKPEHQCFDSNDMFAFMDLNQFYKRGYKSLRDPLPNHVLRIAGKPLPVSCNLDLSNRCRNYGRNVNTQNSMVSLRGLSITMLLWKFNDPALTFYRRLEMMHLQ